MFLVRSFAACGVAVVFATGALAGQDGMFVFGHGGGYSSTSDLNNTGTADFDTGFTVGGGLGWELSKNLGVRADLTFARSDLDDDAGLGLRNDEINRYYYGADLQLRIPIASFAPYIFGGAGGVTLDPSNTEGSDSFTRFAGRFGLGVSYEVAKSGLSLFSQGSGWVYDFDQGSLDGTQFDIGWTAGISLRL